MFSFRNAISCDFLCIFRYSNSFFKKSSLSWKPPIAMSYLFPRLKTLSFAKAIDWQVVLFPQIPFHFWHYSTFDKAINCHVIFFYQIPVHLWKQWKLGSHHLTLLFLAIILFFFKFLFQESQKLPCSIILPVSISSFKFLPFLENYQLSNHIIFHIPFQFWKLFFRDSHQLPYCILLPYSVSFFSRDLFRETHQLTCPILLTNSISSSKIALFRDGQHLPCTILFISW